MNSIHILYISIYDLQNINKYQLLVPMSAFRFEKTFEHSRNPSKLLLYILVIVASAKPTAELLNATTCYARKKKTFKYKALFASFLIDL